MSQPTSRYIYSSNSNIEQSLVKMKHNGGGMASKGVRAISYQVTRKVEAGYNPSHTTETLIGYTACWRFVIFFLRFLSFYFLALFQFPSMVHPEEVYVLFVQLANIEESDHI